MTLRTSITIAICSVLLSLSGLAFAQIVTIGPPPPKTKLEAFESSARAEMVEILAVNRVVKDEVEEECNRVLALTAECLADGADQAAATYELRSERAVLKNKTMALSDLLAVFRAA